MVQFFLTHMVELVFAAESAAVRRQHAAPQCALWQVEIPLQAAFRIKNCATITHLGLAIYQRTPLVVTKSFQMLCCNAY